jgi:hypothetical protein
MMGQNGLFKAAKEYTLEHTAVVDKRQKRPNTFVEVRCVWEETFHEYFDFGFSKCKWPDKWDPDYGVEMARRKAAADIARRMVADGWEPREREI